MSSVSQERRIPQVDKVLRHPLLVEAHSRVKRDILVDLTRIELVACRAALSKGIAVPSLDEIAGAIVSRADGLLAPALVKVINGTGVVLNTNLGRAPLPGELVRRLKQVACGYCNLEIDLESGKRGERGKRVEELIRLLTGAEAALVVNNNAAAVLLAVNTLARDREVIVSRGELIEIGGSFRLPEVIVSSGGILKEIGTTNRTRIGDYRRAINERSGLLLKCHRSNFQITGFTEEADLEALVALARESSLPLVEDLGSGVMVDLSLWGLAEEPVVTSVLATGCDLVTFSGDKLLGGPQAGIVIGKISLIQRLRANPLYRALRADKLILCALETVLAAYLSPQPESKLPALKLISTPAREIKLRVETFVAWAKGQLRQLKLRQVKTEATVGGGSLPGTGLESYGVAIDAPLSPERLAKLLRSLPTPVVAVVQEDQVLLDFRTISKDDELLLRDMLAMADHELAKTKTS